MKSQYIAQDWDEVQVLGVTGFGYYAQTPMWLGYVALRGTDTAMVSQSGLDVGFIGAMRETRPIRIVRRVDYQTVVVYENGGKS